MSKKIHAPPGLNLPARKDDVLAALVSALDGLKYGHVDVTIHEGRVVQLDVTEKKRFSSN